MKEFNSYPKITHFDDYYVICTNLTQNDDDNTEYSIIKIKAHEKYSCIPIFENDKIASRYTAQYNNQIFKILPIKKVLSKSNSDNIKFSESLLFLFNNEAIDELENGSLWNNKR